MTTGGKVNVSSAQRQLHARFKPMVVMLFALSARINGFMFPCPSSTALPSSMRLWSSSSSFTSNAERLTFLALEKARAVASEDYARAAELKDQIDTLVKLESGADNEDAAKPNAGESNKGFRLLGPVSQIYPGDLNLPPMVEQPCELRGTSLRALVKPPDADTLWEWYEAIGSLDADPSWAEIWPTASALAEAIVGDASRLAEESESGAALDKADDRNVQRTAIAAVAEAVSEGRVVELGCGLSLAGIAAAMKAWDKKDEDRSGSSCGPAAAVLLLDREPFALHCALASAKLNGLNIVPVQESLFANSALERPDSPTVSASVLDWSDEAALNALSGVADVVIASDVLYDDDTVVALADTMVRMLHVSEDGRKKGLLAVVDPERERCRGCRAAFLEALNARGASRVAITELPPAYAKDRSATYEAGQPTVLVRAEWH